MAGFLCRHPAISSETPEKVKTSSYPNLPVALLYDLRHMSAALVLLADEPAKGGRLAITAVFATLSLAAGSPPRTRRLRALLSRAGPPPAALVGTQS
jgi:hypothetical protein